MTGAREGSTSPFGTPVVFASTVGLLHPGTGPLAVLMLSPIGYEELCLRATWRSLAQAFSDAGIAALRFDYPGVGDALDTEAPEGLDDWYETVVAAAETLRRASGCERIVLLGQGLGATLATLLAQRLAPVQACVLMAPVSNGKRYLRELSAWSRMVSDRIGIGSDPDDDTGCAVAGLRVPAARLAAIGKLSLAAPERAPAANVLLLTRSQHGGDASLAASLSGLGAQVTQRDYDGYEILTTDPTQALPPMPTIAGIVAWVADRGAQLSASSPVRSPDVQRADVAETLQGADFIERPIRFGPEGRLFGVLCEPVARHGVAAKAATGHPSAIFVNAGRDYHIGWARVTVSQARAFAARGITSLRFDASSIGDSTAMPGGPAEILYSDRQIADVGLAIDAMAQHGFDNPTLIGRCSGAYAAFHATLRDERVRRLVMVNVERFIWNPDESVDDAIRYAHRDVGDFAATLKRSGGMKRLLTGKLRVGAAGRHLLFRLMKTVSAKLAPYLGRLTRQGRLHHACHRHFAALTARKVKIALIFSENDVGLAEFQIYFGQDGGKLAGYPNVSFEVIANADHNFTHLSAGRRLLTTLTRIMKP